MEADHRVYGKIDDFGALANYLTVDLAIGRYCDHHIREDVGGTSQPPPGDELALPVIVELGRPRSREGVSARRHAGRRPQLYLTSATDAAPAADRVEVDPQGAGGFKDGGSLRHRTSPARWNEYDLGIAH
jgi:hypothetical protein